MSHRVTPEQLQLERDRAYFNVDIADLVADKYAHLPYLEVIRQLNDMAMYYTTVLIRVEAKQGKS